MPVTSGELNECVTHRLSCCQFNHVLIVADAKRALALLERVQQRVSTNEGGNGVASQVQTDLDLLTSLLQNPVLRNILKLEDSLEELNQHLVHHPSLLPSDFDIDKAGTLVVNQNILHTHRSGSAKTKEGKASPALSNSSSSKQSTLSPETKKKDVARTGAAFQQSILQAAAKREIIAIQVIEDAFTEHVFESKLPFSSLSVAINVPWKIEMGQKRSCREARLRKVSYQADWIKIFWVVL